MEEKLFEELLESVKEAGQILKGKRQPARTFTVYALDVRRIRESLNLSQILKTRQTPRLARQLMPQLVLWCCFVFPAS